MWDDDGGSPGAVAVLREALRSLRREQLTDPRSWIARAIVWCAAIGVGLSIVGFAELSARAFALFEGARHRWEWLPLLLTPGVGMAAVWLARRYFPGTEGGGIPHVMAAASGTAEPAQIPRFVSVRIALGKIGLVAAALAGGFSVGREGPSVQVGASLLHAARRWLPQGSTIDAHSLIVAGGAAGMAATFNTPLAGIVFAIEQLARRFDERTHGTLLAAIIWGGLVSFALLGDYKYFGRLAVGEVGLTIVPAVLAAGVGCGLAGGAFNRLLLSGVSRIRALAQLRRTRPVVFAGLCGLGVAILGVLTGGATFGGGYESTRELLSGAFDAPWYYALARFASTVLSAVSGIPGGVFAPSLAIGAGIGDALTPLAPSGIGAPALVALCMAAYLAAVTNAPLTSFVVVMEMTDGHAIVLALMAAAFIARLVSRLVSRPLFDTQAARILGPPPPGEPAGRGVT
jgi:H+/Cl- antiporter ClcA